MSIFANNPRLFARLGGNGVLVMQIRRRAGFGASALSQRVPVYCGLMRNLHTFKESIARRQAICGISVSAVRLLCATAYFFTQLTSQESNGNAIISTKCGTFF